MRRERKIIEIGGFFGRSVFQVVHSYSRQKVFDNFVVDLPQWNLS